MSEIRQVLLWQNGMVMTMDEAGNQMPEYQGPVAEVWEKLMRDAPESARYHRGKWGHDTVHEIEQISRVAFIATAAPFLPDARTVEPSQQ